MAIDFSNHKKTNIARIAKFAKALFFQYNITASSRISP